MGKVDLIIELWTSDLFCLKCYIGAKWVDKTKDTAFLN